MPSAPRGHGKGGGRGGGISQKEKACPIAVESRDYKWKLNMRDYGEDHKETREEMRQREAEERQRAREHGDKVDLGKAGEYWEKVSDTTQPRDRRPFQARAPVAQGRRLPAGGHPSAVVPFDGRSSWGTWKAPQIWNRSDWSTSVAVAATPAPRLPCESERTYTSEERARRAAERHREMESRRQTVQARPSYPAVASSSAPLASPRPHPSRSVSSPPVAATSPAKPLSFSLASSGLTDEALRVHCEQASRLLQLGAKPYVQLVDLSHNQITDKGLELLIGFILANGIQIEALKLHGNPRLQLEQTSLVHRPPGPSLLREKMGQGLQELHVSGVQITAESCWRICETCKLVTPTPAFRLCLHGKSKDDCFADGKFLQVFMVARKWELKVSGLESFVAGKSVKDLGEANLHVSAVFGDESGGGQSAMSHYQ